MKTSYLIQLIRACSLAPARVTSSVCLRVRGFRPDVSVRVHSYDDIGSITTYRVAAVLYGRLVNGCMQHEQVCCDSKAGSISYLVCGLTR